MSLEEPIAQATGDATCAPLRRQPETLPLLPVCCICGLIRDETAASPDHRQWVTAQAYRSTHGVNPDEFHLTHTYCSECLTQVLDRVRAYWEEIGA